MNINIINVLTVLFNQRMLRDKTQSMVPSFCIVAQSGDSVLREQEENNPNKTNSVWRKTFLTGGQAGRLQSAHGNWFRDTLYSFFFCPKESLSQRRVSPCLLTSGYTFWSQRHIWNFGFCLNIPWDLKFYSRIYLRFPWYKIMCTS